VIQDPNGNLAAVSLNRQAWKGICERAGAVLGQIEAALFVLGSFWFLGSLSGLLRFRKQVRRAWAQVDVQLRRRWDLVKHLTDLFPSSDPEAERLRVDLSKVHRVAAFAASISQRARAEEALGGTIHHLLLQSEERPPKGLDGQLREVKSALASTQNKIQFLGQFYNDCVMRYNRKMEMVPWRVIASIVSWNEVEFFDMEDPLGLEVLGGA